MTTVSYANQAITQVPTLADFARVLRTHLDKLRPKRILFVCGRHTSDDELTLLAGNYAFSRFAGFSPNPKVEEVHDGVGFYRAHSCDVLIAVGGGSAIDVAKGIKWYLHQDQPESAQPQLWAAPTTAGTGSESTPFAVVYEAGVKQSLDAPFLLPEIAFLCAELILSVPAYHRSASFLDALCQAMESIWSRAATDESRSYAEEAISTLLLHGAGYLDSADLRFEMAAAGEVLENFQEAAAGVLLGANLAGRAIGITRTTAAHAMSYGLTSRYGIAHGHAVALCFSPVCRLHVQEASVAGQDSNLAEALQSIAERFDADTPADIPLLIEGIVALLGLERPHIDSAAASELASTVNAQRLGNNPVRLTTEQITHIYQEVAVNPKGREGATNQGTLNNADPAATGHWTLTHKQSWQKTQIIQEYSIGILKDIDSICQQLGITYFLCEGALLGAVRHGGPIPWDDDIDIAFLRADYDRFLVEAPAYLGDRYVIDTYETNPRHWTISGKVQMTEETPYTRLKTKGLALANGPFVDLFVFDRSPQQSGRRLELRGRYISALRALLFNRSGFQIVPSARRPYLKRFMSFFTPMPLLHHRIDRVCRKYQHHNCSYVTNFGSMYKASQETFHVAEILPVRKVTFGDLQVSVPNRAEKMLGQIYGDFMQMPLYAERTAKHGFVHRNDFDRELRRLIEKNDAVYTESVCDRLSQ